MLVLFFQYIYDIPQSQRNIIMHELAARRCLQCWCRRITKTRLY